MGALPWDLLGVAQERPSENVELNRDSPQARGLVGFWPLSDVSFKDFSGYSFHPTGGAFPSLVPTEFGLAPTFNGTSNRILYQYSVLDYGTGAFTFFAVAKTNGVSGDQRTILSTGDTGAFPKTLIKLNTDGTLLCTVGAGGAADITSSTAFDDGIFHFYVLTRDGSGNIAAYVDGALIGTASDSNDANNGGVSIGSSYNGVSSHRRFWNGEILHVGYKASWISPGEAKSLYNPTTRWDLYSRPKPIVPGFVAAAPAAGVKPPTGLTLLGVGS